MAASLPRPGVLLAIAATGLAVAGFVAGKATSGSTSEEVRTTAPGAPARAGNVLLAPPAGWGTTGAKSPLTGLALEQPVAFAPAADAAEGGLVAGLTPPGSAAPLPDAYLGTLAGAPAAQVLALAETEGFRYAGAAPVGFAGHVTVYAVPTPGASATVLACWARPARTDLLHECEAAVSTLRPALGPSGGLQPNPVYARRVGAIVAGMNRARSAGRAHMGEGASYHALSLGAGGIAEAMGRAASALGALEPPPAVAQAQTQLVQRLQSTRSAYEDLAAAAAGSQLHAYEASRRGLEASEAALSRALSAYTLLGYRRGA